MFVHVLIGIQVIHVLHKVVPETSHAYRDIDAYMSNFIDLGLLI